MTANHTWLGSYSRLHGGWRKSVQDVIQDGVQPCVLTLGVQFAFGLDGLIEEIVRHAAQEYDSIGFEVASLTSDRMAVSARDLHACSFLLIVRRDGKCVVDVADGRLLARMLLRTAARLDDAWRDLRKELHSMEDARRRLEALDRNAEGWTAANTEYLDYEQTTSYYRDELASIEEVAGELLQQLCRGVEATRQIPSEFEAEQWHDQHGRVAEAVAA
jgi:hypothetical protein